MKIKTSNSRNAKQNMIRNVEYAYINAIQQSRDKNNDYNA